ncbi:ABC transporter ATP-binding protein [Intrasporangium sp.]|uniref:ABC transporter ATP-binding protein n=1 Tax=Intrasporangium sp. TaxID=1925024 RepID=UPI002939A027|nr:ABC transporter ATP-binding protein [Intrasporangium sp.]MDV3222353.1 ABC transporter ATP-binding protein [Intrasporangium sp.]
MRSGAGEELSRGPAAAVETTGLTKRFGDLVAVDSLDLHVRSGEVYGFLGPNGAGKTTTLRMLLGLVRPSAGTIRILGTLSEGRGTTSLDRVGALIEGPAFYPFLTGRDNLRSLAARRRLPDGRVAEVLALVGLAERAEDRYGTYSLGMKQRLGLAAALLGRPELLILDEPTNGLDPSGMAEMRAVIRDLADSGCTVLLSSHLLGEVRQICDRVGVVSHGRLVSQQRIDELGGPGALRVRAAPLERARDRLARLVGTDVVTVAGDALEVAVPTDLAPTINRALVADGVAVHELRWHEPDLERVFLDLTKETHDVA